MGKNGQAEGMFRAVNFQEGLWNFMRASELGMCVSELKEQRAKKRRVLKILSLGQVKTKNNYSMKM